MMAKKRSPVAAPPPSVVMSPPPTTGAAVEMIPQGSMKFDPHTGKPINNEVWA